MIDFIMSVFAFVVLAFMFFVSYMSSHMISERKAGRTIPLPWEKGSKLRKVFDKNNVKYSDGDNT